MRGEHGRQQKQAWSHITLSISTQVVGVGFSRRAAG